LAYTQHELRPHPLPRPGHHRPDLAVRPSVSCQGARRQGQAAAAGGLFEELFPGHPDRLRAALVPGRAVQDSLRLDAADAADRRFHPGQQVRVRHPPAGDQQEGHRPGHPKPGDVMVFRYPSDPALDYIKRVVGVPGDVVEYIDKRLTINGKPIAEPARRQFRIHRARPQFRAGRTWREQLGEHSHIAMTQDDMPPVIVHQVEGNFPVPRKLQLQRKRLQMHRAGRALLHARRQPRCLQRFPLLGFCAGGEHRRARILHLVEFR
jgi:hypothetical protein